MYYHIRYWLHTAHGWFQRLIGLMHPECRSLEEVVSELERDPQMRVLMDDARKKLREEDEQREKTRRALRQPAEP